MNTGGSETSTKILGTFARVGLVGIVLAVLIGCSEQNSSPAHAESTPASTKTILIPIGGMSCGACAARVKKTLKAIDGVVEVEISLEHRNGRVRYMGDKVSPERLVAAINQLGYKAGTPRAAGNMQPTSATVGTKAVLIPINGMACEELCVPKVKKALEAIDGVTKVEVSLKSGNARIEYLDGKVSPGELVSVVDKLGFKAGPPVPETLR